MEDLDDAYAVDDDDPASLHSEITQQLRNKIITGELRPNSRILERELAESFGISRTPLREAIKVLASEELVLLQPHRGSVVAPIDITDVDENYEVMEAFEETIGLLAASRANDDEIDALEALHGAMLSAEGTGDRQRYLSLNHDIHLGLARATHNPLLESAYAHSLMKTFRATFILGDAQMPLAQTTADHEQILGLLTQRDGPGLGQALVAHCRTLHHEVVANLKRQHGDTPDRPPWPI